MGNATIYRIRHVLLGSSYVGSTIRQKARFTDHIRSLKADAHPCTALQALWNQDGERAFAFEVLEECQERERYIREQWWIDNSNSELNTYRFATSSHDPAIREKIAEAQRRVSAEMTPEQRKYRSRKPHDFSQTMSSATKGKPQSEAQKITKRRNLTQGQDGNPANKPGWTPHHRVGTKDTDETIEKRRQSRLATEADRRQRGEVRTITEEHKQAIGRSAAARRGEKRTDEAKANMSASAAAAWSDPAKRAAILNARRPFRWMTNGEIDRKLFEGDELSEGWTMGRHHKLT
jgi:group I intron endonuclease